MGPLQEGSFIMLAVPYSRMLLGIVPWYSFLIVLGAAFAIFLAAREEKRTDLEKDTAVDFALIALPCGIIGARIYYVAFSWPSFRDDLLSVFRIWEGGIAIYGGVIAGLLAAWIFSRKRRLSFLTLCDIFAPGLIFAQALGRWGNYFNREAYGLPLTDPSLCFFPFAVLIQEESGPQWHMATFFYESVWNFLVFAFLMVARRKWFRYRGDVISFYAFLYACGRLVIEDFRMDSLYAGSGVRISQMLSVFLCLLLLIRYAVRFRRCSGFSSGPVPVLCGFTVLADMAMVFWLLGWIPVTLSSVPGRFLVLLGCSALNLLSLFVLYGRCAEGECIYADIRRS